MYKKFLTFSLVALLLGACTVKEEIEDNIEHYHKLTRIHNVKDLDYASYTNDIEGVRFLVANHPDQVIHLEGKDFDKRYDKLLNYLKNSGYTVMVAEKLPLTATVIAELDKPLPDLKYVGITMEQNTRMEDTIYSISYGDNKFKARQLYNNYKKSL
ncbi:hypothetical protein LO80_04340 [Candidatus Francisella endociliophora]|uniref:Lipoprotein n=1 Tax=Candidatus Francisella endociliophora TaxID=653937 RepID=A0A097ERT2_9GAMM|nr:hypothetical protein [Francisella sp. FSC1006]AIT10283.1 hypothetical protein LO80_04340 [Francisella sp. FSC1006]